MLRRVATLLLVVAIALGGMVSSACASASCAQMTRSRMHCCPVDGLHAARRCCEGRIAPADPSAAAAFDRVPQAPQLAALPAFAPAVAALVVSDPVAAVPFHGLGPPSSLIRQRTSLLL
ncbi:MAG TPA: hypothetical protein VL049_16190 [Candidatus Dormibacteraeota bacterium]|nr:hypothetical protein [Candidatus Dormibacteraeota bacterium]